MRKSPAAPFAGRAPLPPATAPALALALALGLGVPTASAYSAPPWGTAFSHRAEGLWITVPNAANFGLLSPGGSVSVSLGAVTVEDNRPGTRSWTAVVSATNFTAGSGATLRTIARGNAAYWSGPVTDSSGAGNRIPGQTEAAQRVALTGQVIAFRGSKTPVIPITVTTWRPTIVLTIPAGTATGTYTGAISHSVA
ncbi:hypothetical protein FHS43_002066 [Streptosporangium becharense]|uniref:Uncharacterized protein n=1 Tax=Streptosporangium becharense TaxID=1816182 RepID=A0A7W9MEQ8_9ACTN|nr:hypothetical protein [Streptosporangium becharense]MBB2910803.1 hypothetical protein [Streptosporangium becharense]MBB5817498.1 hypothetical protein [Streptosporangium becharense]